MGVGFLVACAIGVPLTVKYAFLLMPHTALGRQFYLSGNKHEEVHGAAQEENLGDYLGAIGVALCDLRPSGFAQIDGHRVDVITRGEMLDTGSPLKVIKVELNQLIVALDESASN